MGEHLVLCVDRLVTPESLHTLPGSEDTGSSGGRACPQTVGTSTSGIDTKKDEDPGAVDEEEPLLQTVECRICQEEDNEKNLEIPCVCSGSLKYAHRKCVQRWCDEKGDITCEICHQPYRPGYTAPPPPPQSEDTSIDISSTLSESWISENSSEITFLFLGQVWPLDNTYRSWTVGGSQMDLHDPRLLAMAAAERRLLEADYDEYADSSASGAAFCRSAALILMALLLLRHAMTIGNADEEDDDVSTFFSLFLLRAAGFLLPCYIIAWAISMMQRRRQRQEAAALAAAEVAFLLQAGHHRGLHVTIPPAPVPPAEPSTTPGRATTPQVAIPPEQVVATPHLEPV